MTILVAEDCAMIRRTVRGILKRLGLRNIEEAEDGAGALRLLKSKKFDFIISDWNMPHMSGLELLQAVRADEQLKDIPFLMITAEALRDSVVQAVQAGVTGYVVKPFTADTLCDKIQRIFPG
jgi:two-component system chemotaxis response regulator CheY